MLQKRCIFKEKAKLILKNIKIIKNIKLFFTFSLSI